MRSGAPLHPIYPGFTIDGKALVVTEDVGETILTGAAVVRNLSPGRSVTVRGIDPDTLTLEFNQGPVLLEDIGEIDGFLSTFFCGITAFTTGSSVRALDVTSCDAVVLSRCTIGGGFGGTPGIRLTSSTVHMYEVETQGTTVFGIGTADGATGVFVVSSFLFASGGRFIGGCAQDSGTVPCPGIPGDGGAGIHIVGLSQVHLLEVSLEGGDTNDPGICPFMGQPGPPSVGSFNLVAGHARDYAISALAGGGSTATIDYAGEIGDVVLSLVALAQSPLFLLQHAGTLVVAAPPILITHGPTDPAGALSVSVPVPALPPGFEAFTVYAQGAAISALGAAVLAAPTLLTIL